MALKVIRMLIIVWWILFRFVSCSMYHTIGGSFGWNLSSNLSLWSSTTSFFVNDSLVFNYTPDHDVIEVSKSDYENCRINRPISTHADENGQSVVLLSQPGRRYFICGRSNYCSLGLKLSIQVLYQNPELNNTTSDNKAHLPENTPTVGDHDKHEPHSSHGYSNKVTSSKILLHLIITIMGIICIFYLPIARYLLIAGVYYLLV